MRIYLYYMGGYNENASELWLRWGIGLSPELDQQLRAVVEYIAAAEAAVQ